MVVTSVKALCESGGQSTVDGGLHLGKYKTGCILVRLHFDKCMCKWRKSVQV